ncbi:MAG: peptidoglycan DD-metalloendopeptidase family protein [Gemmatimonadota bacterium]
MKGVRSARCLATATFAALLAASGVGAQDQSITQEIQQSQRRLEQIRVERARLERQRTDMQTQVRDASQELQNVERRLSSTMAILSEVELQSDVASEAIETTSRDLLYSKDRLAESEARLNRRLRDIYKMGPLHTVQVLLGARSFADLLNRYRYLQQIASSDRQLVERVRTLEGDLEEQNDQLRQRMALLGTLRQQRVSEVAELRAVEAEHAQALEQFRSRAQQAASRIEALDADAQRLTGLIDELEERRRTLEASRSRAGGSAITTADEGALDWPLDGDLIYRFGLQRQPNGTTVRWNGIGISAPTGTPVRAVRAGQVLYAGPFEGYGPIVILHHGGGFYTQYMYLEDIGVVEGRQVQAGQVVGTVGGRDTPEGPHVEFQIRAPVDGDLPRAQDPLEWLKPLADE